MSEYIATFLAVVVLLGTVELAFWTTLRVHRWLRPAVPGWFKPDLRDEHMGVLNAIPRAPIRYWRWSRKRHRHRWGHWRPTFLQGHGWILGRGCSTCPTTEFFTPADGEMRISKHDVTPAMLRNGFASLTTSLD